MVHIRKAVIRDIHMLQIRAYIMQHGDLRKKEKITIAGEEVEVEVFDDEETEEPPDT